MSKIKKYNKEDVLSDYRLANVSRQCSLLGRKEVLGGKAKFGIFGDGKELAQIAFAKFFKAGDWRSGYYRDQTFMMAAGLFTPEEFFAQLYGETDVELNPGNAGRTFNNHFSTRSLNEDGSWKDLVKQKNSSSDISPTAGQMPRLVGLAYASKLFRNLPELQQYNQFSNGGNEVAFGTIGDASTSEGHFWESMNAAGVLKIPMAMAVWDDGYGISVPQKYQTTKQNISELLKGFELDETGEGIMIYRGKGWDYPSLLRIFEEGISKCREKHIPVLFHIREITQPQGHSTSGSHERYKNAERLQFETDFDCITRFRQWIETEKIATAEEIETIEKEAAERAKQARDNARKAFITPIVKERDELVKIIDKQKKCMCANHSIDKVTLVNNELRAIATPIRKDSFSAVKKLLRHICLTCPHRRPLMESLTLWMKEKYAENHNRYSSHVYSQSEWATTKVKGVPATYAENAPEVNGREILRDNWDVQFSRRSNIMVFGEDAGFIGGVNQSYEGLQKKYGELRVTDTGIRETTILGQGIGLALRGLRPIAEIQYLDYLLYALQTLSDDLACLHWRTKGGQKAPVIITTRGHRLEGVWHAGSPVSMIINSIRGVHVCVPRNMTQAAGFYNTLLEGDEPAIVIEPLNGYRVKEKLPSNLGDYKIALGTPEILAEGTDITLVTYGSCVRIAQEAAEQLREFGVSVELVDVQTITPFDTNFTILNSIKKTHKVLFFDEDVPGGTTAFMLHKVLDEQKAYYALDFEPRCLTAKEHRPAFTTDGDYFSNPNAENVFEAIYDIMHEYKPSQFPKIY